MRSASEAAHRILSSTCDNTLLRCSAPDTCHIRCSAPDNTCHIRCAHRIRPQTPDSATGYPDMAPDMAPYPVRVTDMAPYPVRCTGCVVICYVHRISVTPYPVTISGVWHRMWSSYPVHSSWRGEPLTLTRKQASSAALSTEEACFRVRGAVLRRGWLRDHAARSEVPEFFQICISGLHTYRIS